jgi:DNA polymerase
MGIDLETYSSVSLTDCGVKPYTEDDDFAVLLIGYKVDDAPTRLIDLASSGGDNLSLFPREYTPDGDYAEFTRLLFDPSITKTSYNAQFERTCLAEHYKRPVPPQEWKCTMVKAATLGLPGSLAEVGAVLGLDRQKLTDGKELIKFFCMPRADGRRNMPEDAPEKWDRFCKYCVRDVDVESDVRDRLAVFPVTDAEQLAWILDQQINDFGVRVDREFVHNAAVYIETYFDGLKTEARKLTGIDNPNSGAQLKRWIATKEGISVPSLDKKSLPGVLAAAQTQEVKRVLQIKAELGKTSLAKYSAMERGAARDDRLHNTLQFYGANRTGRWSGRLFQPQNLPRNELPDLALARQLVRDNDFEMLEMAYGSLPFVLSELIRTAIIPSDGCRFLVADYSAIEARVIAWLAGEEWAVEVFRGDGKIYEATAAQLYGIPKEKIIKGNPEYALRQYGKAATLALGYAGGANALITAGRLPKDTPEDDLNDLRDRWRAKNPNIVKFWAAVDRAAKRAVDGHRTRLQHGIHFFRARGYMFIELPSGRRLAYYAPQIDADERGRPQVSFMGVHQNHWTRRRTYGGALVENIVQATARDCLRDAMTWLDAAGYKIAFTVHDEVILDVPRGQGSIDDVLHIMGRSPDWANGLPLRAEGDEMDFYMKA